MPFKNSTLEISANDLEEVAVILIVTFLTAI